MPRLLRRDMMQGETTTDCTDREPGRDPWPKAEPTPGRSSRPARASGGSPRATAPTCGSTASSSPTRRLIEQIKKDQGPEQVVNVATLPGIQKASLAMPDIHWGYGFCIGGVAATDPEEGGVISPGGVGYDINCGVRLFRTNLDVERRQGSDQAAGGSALSRHSHRRRPERTLSVRQAEAGPS